MGEQLEALNFFPPSLSPEGKETSIAALDEVRKLEAKSPPRLKRDVTQLKKIMASGVRDSSSFRLNDFIEAKIAVENWGQQNC